MISATIICLNEEDNIRKAILSLKPIADEVIVIDSGSTDKTVEIAKKLGAKVYFRAFDNFANQKNWAMSKTSGNWIFSLDADEEVTEDLAAEIKEAVKDKSYVGYLIPRKNFILGKEIKYSRWSPDQHVWLWQKEFGKWFGSVHEEVRVSGKVGLLKNCKIHRSHKTLTSFMDANNLYSTFEAESLHKNKISFSFWRMIWEPIFEFSLRYIYKKGFLDGKEGFALSYAMGVYRLSVWVKIWELERNK